LEELFDLIHRHNPTGRDMSEAERRQAYALKADLQSLLIETYGEDLRLEDVLHTDGSTIGLRHRSGKRDACHAIESALSPAARAWVRWQQDLELAASSARAVPQTRPDRQGPQRPAHRDGRAGPPAHPTTRSDTPQTDAQPSDAPPTDALALITAGEAALAGFDFEQARERLEAAMQHADTLASPQLALKATRALVRLLGDHLAAYEELIALRSALHPIARDDAEIRCLLALAAAKARRPELATQLVQGLETDRVVEVRLELARQALQDDDLHTCKHCLDQLPRASLLSPEAQTILSALRDRRAHLAAPLAACLAEHLAQQHPADPTSLSDLAHDILELDPDHPLARETLARLRQQREDEELQHTCDRINVFLDQGDADSASHLLRHLDPGDPRHAPLQRRLDDLRSQQQAAVDREQLTRLLEALDATPTADWILDFWTASPTVQESLIASAAQPWLVWLRELGPISQQSRAHAVATALRTLQIAEQQLSNGRAIMALEKITPHLPILTACPRGKEWSRQLHHEADTERELQRAAQDIAEQDAKRQAEEDRESAQQERRTLLQSMWVEAQIEGIECSGLLDRRSLHLLGLDNLTPLHTSGDRLIHAESLGGRIHIHVFAQSPERERHVILCAPGPFRMIGSQVTGEVLHLLGEQAHLEIDIDTMQIQDVHDLTGTTIDQELWLEARSLGKRTRKHKSKSRRSQSRKDEAAHWVPPPNALPTLQEIDSAFVAPGMRHLWLGQGGFARYGVQTIDPPGDLAFFRLRRLVWPIWGASSPLILTSTDRAQCQGMDDSGRLLWEYRSPGTLLLAVGHPSGQSFVVFCAQPKSESTKGTLLVAEERSLTGELRNTLELEEYDTQANLQAICAKDSDCIYVAVERRNHTTVLRALEPNDTGLGVASARTVIGQLLLVGDASGSRALAVHRVDGYTELLNPSLVPIPGRFAWAKATALPQGFELPTLDDLIDCGAHDADILDHKDAFRAVLPLLRGGDLPARIRAWLGTDPSASALLALHAAHLPDEARAEIRQQLQDQHPDDPRTRMLQSALRIQEGLAREAQALLDSIDVERLSREQQQHLLHLRAITELTLGEPRQARKTLKTAARLKCSSCDLDPLRTVLDTLLLSPRRLARAAKGRSFRAFIASMLAADHSVAADDLARARQFLGSPLCQTRDVVQVAARMADVYLQPLRHAVAGIRLPCETTLVLDNFLELWSHSPECRGGTPFPLLGPHMWSADRLRQLAREASQMLSEPLPSPRLATRVSDPEDLDILTAGATFTTMMPEGKGQGPVGQHHSDTQALRRHELRLVSQAQECRHRRNMGRMVGLVLDPDHPMATAFATARSLHSTYQPPGPEIALPVTIEAAFLQLSRWPDVMQTFIGQHNAASLEHRHRLTLLHLTTTGAAFAQSRS